METMRLVTVRVYRRLSLAGLAFTTLVSAVMAVLVSDFTVTGASLSAQLTWILTGGSSFAYLPVGIAVVGGVLGALAVGTEYEHRTILVTLVAFPRRLPLYAAKVVAASVWSLAVLAASLAIGIAVVEIVTPYSWGTWAIPVSLSLMAYVWSFTAVGIGLAALLQNQRASIVTLLIWPFCVEPGVIGRTSLLDYWGLEDISAVVNFLPESVARRALQAPFGAYTYPGVWDGTDRVECLSLLVVVALAVVVMGGWRFARASVGGT